MAHAYKFGIEEEFFLVDAETKSAARAMPAAFLASAKKVSYRSGRKRLHSLIGWYLPLSESLRKSS